MRPGGSVVLAAAVCATAAPVHAATLEELARKAVFEQCPELMGYEGALAEDANIVAEGYLPAGTREHPRAGTLDVVEKKTDDGTVWIGNSRDVSMCQVGIEGARAKAIFDALFAARDAIADDLRSDDSEVSQLEGVRIVTLRTETFDGGYLGVQFIDPTAVQATAPLIIQQYYLEDE